MPVDEVGPLLDRLGGPADVLWPSPAWQPMVLDRPVGVGAVGGHGPFRYRVTAHRPGRRVEFTFEPGQEVRGTHTFTAQPSGEGRTVLRHIADAEVTGVMRVLWPLAARWLHDAVVEDLLDRAEVAVGTGPARPARWSPWVRLLRCSRLTHRRSARA
ncbi:MAG: SRPBCC family protein, partial [Pseudonocardia sp.]|nr:SRPBCC family protein [Pseudonocardia sp.]